jgi:hypothetical protein
VDDAVRKKHIIDGRAVGLSEADDGHAKQQGKAGGSDKSGGDAVSSRHCELPVHQMQL